MIIHRIVLVTLLSLLLLLLVKKVLYRYYFELQTSYIFSEICQNGILSIGLLLMVMVVCNFLCFFCRYLWHYRYNKPLQASVRAVTSGTLWALKREDFRGILMSEFSNLSSLKLLRSVDLLSRLTILQLSHIADSLSEVSFSDGQTIVDKVMLLY